MVHIHKINRIIFYTIFYSKVQNKSWYTEKNIYLIFRYTKNSIWTAQASICSVHLLDITKYKSSNNYDVCLYSYKIIEIKIKCK